MSSACSASSPVTADLRWRKETSDEAPEGQLVLDLDGYEGPIDVLLTLARDQKVDLTRISILQLADQYLAFVAEARRIRLELAADYLVMAAWLAYLKSRLLLPEQDEEEPSGEDLAQALAFQLQRLEAMQEVGAKLVERPRLGRDVFARGAPEGIQVVSKSIFDLSLYDLLKAYTEHKRKEEYGTWRIQPTELYSMEDALQHLSEMLGRLPDWTALASFVPGAAGNSLLSRSALAAHFVASLELTKAGKLELRQEGVFSPIYLRRVRSHSAMSPELRLLEALIFASAEPLDERTLADRLGSGVDIGRLLAELKQDYAGRGIDLVRTAGRWSFRTAPDLAEKLRVDAEVQRKLSRATVETLAIIAYHQPVTRAEIESIRGVATSKGTLDILMEAGWVRPGKRRETPGRPLTWITTDGFLDHFGLESLRDLPNLEDLKASGLLDSRPVLTSIQGGVGGPAASEEELDNAQVNLHGLPASPPLRASSMTITSTVVTSVPATIASGIQAHIGDGVRDAQDEDAAMRCP